MYYSRISESVRDQTDAGKNTKQQPQLKTVSL